MEAQIGPQVAPPPMPSAALHQPATSLLFHGVPSSSDREASPSRRRHDRLDHHSSGDSSSNDPSSSDWSPDVWRWDPVAFSVKPSSLAAASDPGARGEARTRQGENGVTGRGSCMASSSGNRCLPDSMKPQRSSCPVPGDSVARPNKRVRAESPDGSSGRNKQMCCQVDDCDADLSKQKDYYRRHKVCETHSKSVKALIGNQMQRFCQQCSRFHLLSEFDEGKRSCRSRLAGHNRRRRKTLPGETSSLPTVSSDHDGNASMSSKIVNVLAILARIQDSSSLVKSAKSSRIADVSCLDEVVGTLNSLHTSSTRKDPPICEGFNLNVSHDPILPELPPEENNDDYVSTALDLRTSASNSSRTTKVDCLTPASPATHSSTIDKAEKTSLEPFTDVSSDDNSSLTVPNHGVKLDKDAFTSTLQAMDCTMDETRPTLQLFNMTKNDVSLNTKYVSKSSEMSRIVEKQCPSQTVTHNLFPLCPGTQTSKDEAGPVSVGEIEATEENTRPKLNPSLELFNHSLNIPEVTSTQVPSQSGLLCTTFGFSDLRSGSDLSQLDRTGRILFKLFDKHPSDIPRTIRNQILSWLSHSPSDMESYIRPGCIVLSVYISMPCLAWDDIKQNLVSRLDSLIKCSNSDFWRRGRLLVKIDQKLVFNNDGRIHLCKHGKNRSAPELLQVSPLAVVSGNETSLLLRGRNLRIPGTKIHCTYMGGYISKEVQGSYSDMEDSESGSETLLFPGGSPGTYGRCYIEVEHRLNGNSFPVIIADRKICEELGELEVELEGARDMFPDSSRVNFEGSSIREDIFYFLEELGWLFQRSNFQSTICLRQFSVTRFMFVAIFSVDRGWSALLKRILDIFVEMSLGKDNLTDEFLKSFGEVCLLNQAIKGKCRKMVDMLLHYTIDAYHTSSKVYPFPPNLVGLGGITPLHLAASMEDSEDMVDALTNDPQGVGLASWKSATDDSGLSPYDYASLRNHHSYNQLVERKLENKRNHQVSVTICEGQISSSANLGSRKYDVQSEVNPSLSCSQCAMLENRRLRGIIQAKSMKYRPYFHFVLTIAMVCMCVSVFLRGAPEIGLVAPFKWQNIDFGTM